MRNLSARVIALPNGARKVRGYAVSAHLLAEEAHCRAARRGQRGQGLDGSFIPDSKAESNFIILLEKSAQTGNRGEVSGALNRPLQSPVQRPEI
jgi:hypothetical protein